MPSNKDRLYVCLYARAGAAKMPGREDQYHWALLVGPQEGTENDHGTRYHAKERISAARMSEWIFEEQEITPQATQLLLVRVIIGKVERKVQLAHILRKIPIKQGEGGRSSVEWVKEGIRALKSDGKTLGTSVTEWQKVRDAAIWYVEKKKAEHRFDGKGNFDTKYTATYDMLEKKDTVPC